MENAKVLQQERISIYRDLYDDKVPKRVRLCQEVVGKKFFKLTFTTI
ncbi:hypothetical protein L1766_06440 [Thermovorax subterraneus]|nr:hypothetical protein [Thermovorax subterraneus]